MRRLRLDDEEASSESEVCPFCHIQRPQGAKIMSVPRFILARSAGDSVAMAETCAAALNQRCEAAKEGGKH